MKVWCDKDGFRCDFARFPAIWRATIRSRRRILRIHHQPRLPRQRIGIIFQRQRRDRICNAIVFCADAGT